MRVNLGRIHDFFSLMWKPTICKLRDLCSDLLSERIRWAHLPRSGVSRIGPAKNFSFWQSGFYLGFIVLGGKSRKAEGHELPRGVRRHAPPEIFWNEYALRYNLVHFETQFWEMLQWYFILFFSRDHVLTMLHLAPIFFLGGGGKLGIFLGEGFYPSDTLDRTLAI